MLAIRTLSGGGAELVVETLATGLDRSRFDVVVCELVGTGEKAEGLRARGYEVVSLLPSGNVRSAYVNFIRLRRFVAARRIDVVHSHSAASPPTRHCAGCCDRRSKWFIRSTSATILTSTLRSNGSSGQVTVSPMCWSRSGIGRQTPFARPRAARRKAAHHLERHRSAAVQVRRATAGAISRSGANHHRHDRHAFRTERTRRSLRGGEDPEGTRAAGDVSDRWRRAVVANAQRSVRGHGPGRLREVSRMGQGRG